LEGCDYVECARRPAEEIAVQFIYHQLAGGRGEYAATNAANVRIWIDPIHDGSLNLLWVSINGESPCGIRTDRNQEIYRLRPEGKRLLAINPRGKPLLIGLHSWSDLADYYDVAEQKRNAFKVKLYRFRDSSDSGWNEIQNPGHRSARYLFDARAVAPIIREYAGVPVE